VISSEDVSMKMSKQLINFVEENGNCAERTSNESHCHERDRHISMFAQQKVRRVHSVKHHESSYESPSSGIAK
jgi:hypothetical protein